VVVSTPPIYRKPSWVMPVREPGVVPITSIGQHYAHRDLLLESLPNLLQRNFRLGLKFHTFGHAGRIGPLSGNPTLVPEPHFSLLLRRFISNALSGVMQLNECQLR
jgi:hypothetical protein